MLSILANAIPPGCPTLGSAPRLPRNSERDSKFRFLVEEIPRDAWKLDRSLRQFGGCHGSARRSAATAGVVPPRSSDHREDQQPARPLWTAASDGGPVIAEVCPQ